MGSVRLPVNCIIYEWQTTSMSPHSLDGDWPDISYTGQSPSAQCSTVHASAAATL